MKRILLCFTLLTFGFTGTNAQSFEINPHTGTLNSSSPNLYLRGNSTPLIRGLRSNGILSSPTAVQVGQSLIEISGSGYVSSATYIGSVAIRMSATENWAASKYGSKIGFFTSENGMGGIYERLSISDKGYLGLNNTDPGVPFHINHSNITSNSSTGDAIIGSLGGQHLSFDGDEINAWNGTSGSAFYLNRSSPGAVVVGNFTALNESDLFVSGFTRLGTGAAAPKIKIKKLTGTTSATAGTANIAHGIGDSDKILSVDISINNAGKTYISENYTQSAGLEFNYYYNDTNIGVVTKSGNSASLNSRPIKILITYEE
ncbi:hypothetical protein [Arcticibacterium luteifluviistationis]|uniref:Uncharacterized protein n=1 Tax=Arcticibacterium luteifluviistationis TaxID=1784714 RepID=A0A2Z4GAC6_9BACT|nr:hypothetical protein [Arcticibacterium luteifluviistationis]AWV98018.1 hypothetical protein DJ013_07470 [Arcticibacterium luteifluviistationis]